MGCCQSTAEDSRPITAGNNRASAAVRKGKEDKIELAFKAKRANVFTEGVDLGRNAFSIKRLPKNAKQTQLICKSFPTVFNIYSMTLFYTYILLLF